LLANDIYKKAMAASDRAEKRVHFEGASKHTDESLKDFPEGFVQEKPTKVLQSLVAEELKKLGEP
jgi:hypothetical protein